MRVNDQDQDDSYCFLCLRDPYTGASAFVNQIFRHEEHVCGDDTYVGLAHPDDLFHTLS